MNLYDKKNKIFDAENERYQMLFSFKNLFCVLRTSADGKKDSSDYDIVACQEHTSYTPEDVLKDIQYMLRAGKIELEVNDIVSIKISGMFSGYHYCGKKYTDSVEESFTEINAFLKEEQQEYISLLHSENRVLSVLDGKTFDAAEVNTETQSVCCIESEVFRPFERVDGVISDYSLYVLGRDNKIRKINPYPYAFISVKHALYYFFKCRVKNMNAMLLFSLHELEMVKDFHELTSMVC